MKSESSTKAGEKHDDRVYIHPLVILNVSDHWTRIKAQSDAARPVFGALLGKQKGRETEICNSFELTLAADSTDMAIDIEGDPKIIDEEYFGSKMALYKETFADLEFLGFYTTGFTDEVSPEDEIIQRQAMKANEAPFLLKLNTLAPTDYDRLQISIFESIVDPTDETKLIFQPVFHKIQSEYSEQIGLDHVDRYAKGGDSGASFSRYVSSHLGPVNALLQQIHIALEYVKSVKNNELAPNNQILMDIHKLCVKLTTLDEGESTSNDLKKFSTDQKLIVLLSALTNVEGSMFSLISKLNVLSSDRHGPSSSSLHPLYREKIPSHFWRDVHRASTGPNNF